MAEFTFGDHRENDSIGGKTDGASNGKSGESSGNSTIENGNTGTENETGRNADQSSAAGQPKKRRGRKPYPRDPITGEPIRPVGGTESNRGTEKDKGPRLAIKNDREKVRANITGLHAMAAVLTKQPILQLSDNEAIVLTNSICDLADYHGMNLLTSGGAFGLYASLVTTVYMIYMPRIMKIKFDRAAAQAKPVNPSDYREESEARQKSSGTMDFSSDVLH